MDDDPEPRHFYCCFLPHRSQNPRTRVIVPTNVLSDIKHNARVPQQVGRYVLSLYHKYIIQHITFCRVGCVGFWGALDRPQDK